MKYQISHISSHRTSMFLAIMAVIITLPLAVIGLLGMFFSGNVINYEFIVALSLFVFMPLLYGVIAYVCNRFFCVIYNMVAKRTGGIEVTLQQDSTK